MDLRQINILDIVRTVVIANLSASPVDTFDLYDLPILDGTIEGNYLIISVWQ